MINVDYVEEPQLSSEEEERIEKEFNYKETIKKYEIFTDNIEDCLNDDRICKEEKIECINYYLQELKENL